jgi:hypothetical protein
MKTSRNTQWLIATLVFTFGCVALVTHAVLGIVVICFCFPTIILMRRAERKRSLTPRDLWITMTLFAAFVGLIVLANLFIPKTTGEYYLRYLRHPAVVLSMWVIMMGLWLWRYRKEQKAIEV